MHSNETMISDGTTVGNLDDLAVGEMKMVKVDGQRICLGRTDGGVFALDQACPHQGYGLTTGSLDGDLLTCEWHNWKFRASDGRCVVGQEDVASHPVSVDANGDIAVTIRRPKPAEQIPKFLASLRRGIEHNYIGQISRDVVRLLHAGTEPAEIVALAVEYGAPRGEYGWGHDIATLTDCLSMVPQYHGDDRALPVVQAISGVAEVARGRPAHNLATPVEELPTNPRAVFRDAVESERLDDAQAVLRAAIRDGYSAEQLAPWFGDVVADHHLGYGHGAIYSFKAFELLDMIGWRYADVVLGHLVMSLVYETREDKLPYMVPFRRAMDDFDLGELAAVAVEPRWDGEGDLVAALLGDDRAAAAGGVGRAFANGAGADRILDAVVRATSHRLLRYDIATEYDLHDDFGWLDITHALTYANAIRWHLAGQSLTGDGVKLVMWGAFLANWTGRHEWHTAVGDEATMTPLSDDLGEYGLGLQAMSLRDGATAFIQVAHLVKMSVAATAEALILGDRLPLDATARFIAGPRQERSVAANVTRSIDFLAGRTVPDRS